MGFQKHKTGIIVSILCLLALAAVIWFCLLSPERKAAPEGTLVEQTSEWAAERLGERLTAQPEVVG